MSSIGRFLVSYFWGKKGENSVNILIIVLAMAASYSIMQIYYSSTSNYFMSNDGIIIEYAQKIDERSTKLNEALQQQIDNLTIVDSANKDLIVIYDDTTLVSLQQELRSIQTDLSTIDERQTALTQAISPTNPEEILTIARLTDAVNLLAERIDRQDEELERKQQEFRESVIRELEKDDTLLLALIPVILLVLLKFIIDAWRDRPKKKVAAAPPKPTTEA